MAVGVVMVQLPKTDRDALRWLTEASQRTNRKLRLLAEDIVQTGSLEI